MFCPMCGHEMHNDAEYCPNCGVHASDLIEKIEHGEDAGEPAPDSVRTTQKPTLDRESHTETLHAVNSSSEQPGRGTRKKRIASVCSALVVVVCIAIICVLGFAPRERQHEPIDATAISPLTLENNATMTDAVQQSVSVADDENAEKPQQNNARGADNFSQDSAILEGNQKQDSAPATAAHKAASHDIYNDILSEFRQAKDCGWTEKPTQIRSLENIESSVSSSMSSNLKTKITREPISYAYLDFDNDGTNELVIAFAEGNGGTLITDAFSWDGTKVTKPLFSAYDPPFFMSLSAPRRKGNLRLLSLSSGEVLLINGNYTQAFRLESGQLVSDTYIEADTYHKEYFVGTSLADKKNVSKKDYETVDSQRLSGLDGGLSVTWIPLSND